MKIPKSKGEMCPEGVHKAVCVYVVDMGTQEPSNPKFSAARKVRVGFELQGIRKKSGDPFLLFQSYTFSSNPKANLMKDLKAWLGIKDKDVDMDELLGKGAMVTVSHSEDGQYANVTNITGLPKGVKLAKPETKPYSLYLDETFDADVYNELPDSFKERIAASPEYDEVAGAPSKPKKRGK